ncbi:hypothetical protein [Streptomyces prasinus]|uniref:hypothetical protein n=1 Tax=Streptomyces prasinus TaxID=67345 RepID=UPI0036CFEDFD
MTGPLCGARHWQHPDTLCTELTGHDRADGSSPHAGLLIIDGREAGVITWNEPKEKR